MRVVQQNPVNLYTASFPFKTGAYYQEQWSKWCDYTQVIKQNKINRNPCARKTNCTLVQKYRCKEGSYYLSKLQPVCVWFSLVFTVSKYGYHLACCPRHHWAIFILLNAPVSSQQNKAYGLPITRETLMKCIPFCTLLMTATNHWRKRHFRAHSRIKH